MSIPKRVTGDDGRPVLCQECGAALMEGHEKDPNYHYPKCRMP